MCVLCVWTANTGQICETYNTDSKHLPNHVTLKMANLFASHENSHIHVNRRYNTKDHKTKSHSYLLWTVLCKAADAPPPVQAVCKPYVPSLSVTVYTPSRLQPVPRAADFTDRWAGRARLKTYKQQNLIPTSQDKIRLTKFLRVLWSRHQHCHTSWQSELQQLSPSAISSLYDTFKNAFLIIFSSVC